MFYSRKLKKFTEIKHCFFSRKGGFSKGIYESLNCGKGSKDNKDNIVKNLKFISKTMMVKEKKLILMHQTHSDKVVEITNNNYRKKIFSDAMFTKKRGLALCVLTADCVPILIFNKKNNIIGCVHAGWKGAFSGIIEKTIKKLRKEGSVEKIFASVGPCIGTNNYEVDLKFYKKFLSKSKSNKRYFLYKNKYKKKFNLRKYVADKLLKLKVKIDHVKRDTFKENDNFFSFRRSSIMNHNDYGRCISVIRLK